MDTFLFILSNGIDTPTPFKDEVIYKLIPGVCVKYGAEKSGIEGTLTLSSHRFYLVDSQRTKYYQFHHAEHLENEFFRGSLWNQARLRVLYTALPRDQLASGNLPHDAKSPPPSSKQFELFFTFPKKDDGEEVSKQFSTILARRAWVKKAPKDDYIKIPLESSSSTGTPSIIGIGLIRSEDEKRRLAARKEAEGVLQSFGNFQASADTLLSLARDYAAKIRSRSDIPTPTAGEDGPDLTPITKDIAGDKYLEELARQMSDVLVRRMDACGGVMMLADAFCIYNRMRGTDPISPDDLLRSLAFLPRLGRPVDLALEAHTYASGLRVLRLCSHSESAAARRILKFLWSRTWANVHQHCQSQNVRSVGVAGLVDVDTFVAQGNPLCTVSHDVLKKFGPVIPLVDLPFEPSLLPSVLVIDGQTYPLQRLAAIRGLCSLVAFASPLDICGVLHTPLEVSKQILLSVERSGQLVRDDSMAGLRFYANPFF